MQIYIQIQSCRKSNSKNYRKISSFFIQNQTSCEWWVIWVRHLNNRFIRPTLLPCIRVIRNRTATMGRPLMRRMRRNRQEMRTNRNWYLAFSRYLTTFGRIVYRCRSLNSSVKSSGEWASTYICILTTQFLAALARRGVLEASLNACPILPAETKSGRSTTASWISILGTSSDMKRASSFRSPGITSFGRRRGIVSYAIFYKSRTGTMATFS